MAQGAEAWRAVDGGVRLAVRVTPNAGRACIDGLATLADGETVLKLRVAAVPDKGAANAAALALLAKRLGLPKRAVTLVSGATARRKHIHLDADAQAIAARLSDICGGRGV